MGFGGCFMGRVRDEIEERKKREKGLKEERRAKSYKMKIGSRRWV